MLSDLSAQEKTVLDVLIDELHRLNLQCSPEEIEQALLALMKLHELVQEVDLLEKEVLGLHELMLCNGWLCRRADGSMYAHHRKKTTCPHHGAAVVNADRGLRVYVRQEDVPVVGEAIERYVMCQQKERLLKRRMSNLANFRASLQRLTEYT